MSRLVIVLGLFLLVDVKAAAYGQTAKRASTLGVEEPENTLAQNGLRGRGPIDEDIQKHYKKIEGEIKEKLASIPNHWDLPLGVARKDMTWTMFVRSLEKEALLAVHEGYMTAWCGAVSLLLLLSGAFFAYSRSKDVKDSSEVCQPFDEVPTGESENAKVLVQKGCMASTFGSFIFWMWVLLPLLGYVQMAVIALDHYLFAIHEPDLTWNQWAQPYLVVFVLSHFTLFLQTQYLARARVFFMLPAPLATATKVLIQDM